MLGSAASLLLLGKAERHTVTATDFCQAAATLNSQIRV
jgi:hypothetical protein